MPPEPETRVVVVPAPDQDPALPEVPSVSVSDAPSEPLPVAATPGPGDPCGAQSVQALVGQPESVFFSMSLPDDTRFLGPGEVVTLEFDEDRLNFAIDDAGRINRAYCG